MASYTDKRANDLQQFADKLQEFSERRVMDGEDDLFFNINQAVEYTQDAAGIAQDLANNYRKANSGDRTPEYPAKASDDSAVPFLRSPECP